jgi:phage tail P2-like protein
VPSLLPPNSTPLERTLEAVGAHLLSIPVPLRTLWNAEKIDVKLLPWLAWSMGLDSWKTYWPDAVKRARTRQGIDIARRKGTAKAVRDVAQAFGAFVTIKEWWQMEPKGEPRTFNVLLTLSGQGGSEASAAMVADVIAEIRRTKPASAHFTVTQGLHVAGHLTIATGLRALTLARLKFSGVA